MDTISQSVKLKNIARGGQPCYILRKKVAQLLLSSPTTELEPLGAFLSQTFFNIKKKSWSLLPLSDEDWGILRAFRKSSGSTLTANYLSLTLQYIETNKSRVSDMYEVERKVSSDLIHGRNVEAANAILNLDKCDINSLFASRLTAALNSHDSEQLLKLFGSSSYSDWFRIRFLYPFVYYFVVCPSDSFLDHHLSYAIPPGHDDETERAAIRFLLRDEVCFKESLAFKCYLALTTHPYDACEILLNHCKCEFSKNGSLGDMECTIIDTLDSILPNWKKDILFEIMRGGLVEETPNASAPRICRILETSPEITEFFAQYLSLGRMSMADGPIALDLYSQLYRLRDQKYPLIADYQTVVNQARRYRFLTFGKALKVVLSSLYMFARKSTKEELIELVDLTCFNGGYSAYVATSPGGHTALQKGIICVAARSSDEFMEFVSSQVEEQRECNDRNWIKCIQWKLICIEATGKVQLWLETARRDINVAPNYLSGIDWHWVDDIISAVRIGPFRGNSAGVYVLFLEFLERSNRGTNRLRIAIEPIAQSSQTVGELLRWLIKEYGENAIAFVRFFLSGDLIMKLRLADNYTAAISEQIAALEMCAKRFKLESPLLTEEILTQEQQAFTSSLIRINVGTNQFEVSWDILVRDILADHSDEFKAYSALATNPEMAKVLSLRNFSFSYHFSIGESKEYRTRYVDWASVSVILTTIDSFMKHPSQGIESILSIRIRHGRFERELLTAVNTVKVSRSTGIKGADLQTFVPHFESALASAIQTWLDQYMHERRPDKPDAIFEFAPSQRQLDALLKKVRETNNVEEAVRQTVNYLRETLDAQLKAARRQLIDSLFPVLCQCVDGTVDNIEKDTREVASPRQIAKVIKSTLEVRVKEMREWFQMSRSDDALSVSLNDIGATVSERFKDDVDRSNLRISVRSNLPTRPVQGHHIRLIFDLWCEAVANAISHSKTRRSYIKVSALRSTEKRGVVFSSLCAPDSSSKRVIKGHPYQSMSDKLFNEGASGLEKIASLAASVVEQPIEIEVVRKSRSFHVLVPLFV